LSINLGASTSWNPKGLSRPVVGLLYLFVYVYTKCSENRLEPSAEPTDISGYYAKTTSNCWDCEIQEGTKTGHTDLMKKTRHVYVILVEKPLGK
jgi:hypothetical protein